MKRELKATSSYKKDFSKLGNLEQSQINKKLNFFISLFADDRKKFLTYVRRPIAPRLSGGLTSTLYILPISAKIRILFVYDEDPLFEVISFTLLRVFTRDVYKNEFLKEALAFYRPNGITVESI